MGYVTRFTANQVGYPDFEIWTYVFISYVKNVLIFSTKPSQATIRS